MNKEAELNQHKSLIESLNNDISSLNQKINSLNADISNKNNEIHKYY